MNPSANSKSPSKSVATASHTTTTTTTSFTPSLSQYKTAEAGFGSTPSSTTTVKKSTASTAAAPTSSSSQPSTSSTSTSKGSPAKFGQKYWRTSVKKPSTSTTASASARRKATPSSVTPEPSTRRSTRASGPKGPFVRLATPSTDHRVQIQEQKSPRSTRESREHAESRHGSRRTRTRSTTGASESESSDSESDSDSGTSTPEPLSISAVIPGIGTDKSSKTNTVESKTKDRDVEMTGPSEANAAAPNPSSTPRNRTPPTLASSVHPSSSGPDRPPTDHAEDEALEDGEKPWLHPSELPYIQRSDWTQDATITYLVQNVFSIPKRVKGGKVAQAQRENRGELGSMCFVKVESGFPNGSATTVGGVVGGTMEGTPPLEGGPSSTASTSANASKATRFTYLPRGYRIPLMFVAKFQWESLRLVLTSGRPDGEWDEFKYDIVHLSRLCSHLLKDAQAAAALPPTDDGDGEWTKEGDVEVRSSAGKGGYKDERVGQMTKQWRCAMFDRALTRFFRKWMICREWSVKYFWDEYGEEEYEFDVLKHDWARWVLKGHKGFLLTKDEVELGISADQFLAGLDRITDSTGKSKWVWDNERYVGARGLAVTGGSTNHSTDNTPKRTPSGMRKPREKKDGGKEMNKDGAKDKEMSDEVKVKKEMIEASLPRPSSASSSVLSASVPPTPTLAAPPKTITKTAATSTTSSTTANAKANAKITPPSPRHTPTLPPRFAASKSTSSIASRPTNPTSTAKLTATTKQAVAITASASIPSKSQSVLVKPVPPPGISAGPVVKPTTVGNPALSVHKVASSTLPTTKDKPLIPATSNANSNGTTSTSVLNGKKRAREEEEEEGDDVAASKRVKATTSGSANRVAEKAAEETKQRKRKEIQKEKDDGAAGDAMDVDQPDSGVKKTALAPTVRPARVTSPSTNTNGSALEKASNLMRPPHPFAPPPSPTSPTSSAPQKSPTISSAFSREPVNFHPTLSPAPFGSSAFGSTSSLGYPSSPTSLMSSVSSSAAFPASLSTPSDASHSVFATNGVATAFAGSGVKATAAKDVPPTGQIPPPAPDDGGKKPTGAAAFVSSALLVPPTPKVTATSPSVGEQGSGQGQTKTKTSTPASSTQTQASPSVGGNGSGQKKAAPPASGSQTQAVSPALPPPVASTTSTSAPPAISTTSTTVPPVAQKGKRRTPAPSTSTPAVPSPSKPVATASSSTAKPSPVASSSTTAPVASSSTKSPMASSSTKAPVVFSSTAAPVSLAAQVNVPPYLKFVKDLSEAFGTRLDGAVEKIVEAVRKFEREARAPTPAVENGKTKQPEPVPELATGPEMKQALEALLGLLEYNTRLRELVTSGSERALKELGSITEGQQKAGEQGQKIEAVVEATWGVVNYVETLLREVKDVQYDMGRAHDEEVVNGVARDNAVGELSTRLDSIERVVGEFRTEIVSKMQGAKANAEQNRDDMRKEVGGLRGMLEEAQRERKEADRRREEREKSWDEAAKKILGQVKESIEVARDSRKAVEELKAEVRMRDAARGSVGATRRETVTSVRVLSEVAIQAEPVDVEMGDVQADERRRKAIAASKAKKALDVVQHMADLPGFSYSLHDEDDIQSSEDGVVAIRTRAISTKGKEREVVARPPATAHKAPAPEHSESTMLALLLDEFRLIKDKLNSMERRSREEVASTKLLHSADLDTLRSEMERRDEEDRRLRELEARLERERQDREKERQDRLERGRCERLARVEREKRELAERVDRIERERAESKKERERERLERENERERAESGPSSSSRAYRDHLNGYDADSEIAELKRRLAYYESRTPHQASVPPLPHRESSSGSLSNSGLPHRDASEPLYPPDPPRRDRSSSIASSSNNVETAKRPLMINTNVGGSSMMDVDGAGGSVSVPAKAQRKMMRRDHGNMPPPSGEP